jgi:hypothetical protein
MRHPMNRVAMYAILVVVGANYLAQIPYYLYLYYLPHRALPPLFGTSLLAVTFVWFLVGWLLLARRGSRTGYWLLLTFLLTEFIFYFLNMANQVVHGFAPFFHLQNRDPLLLTVFAIGYLNMVGGFAFIIFLVLRYRTLVADQRPAQVWPA